MEDLHVSLHAGHGDMALRATSRRDPAAFADLIAAHNSDLLRVAYVILGDTALAEDAVQNAWIKAWRKIGDLKAEDKLRNWLIAIAANEARQIARRKRRMRFDPSADSFGRDADPGLVDLSVAIARLNADDRRLLSLRYVADFSSPEIASHLGISSGAVRHRLMRLLTRLRLELE